MAGTPRLSLPFLSVGQAQKEFTHNESLQTLDTLVGGAIEEPPRAAPPSAPSLGACYIVANGATDAWAGKADCIATWTSGGWRFIFPRDGMILFERTSGVWAVFRNGAWELGILSGTSLEIGGQQVVSSRAAAIASPAGGAVVDAEARQAVAGILGALRQHGLIET